ncbi:MAG: PAS domain S-box protein [Trueperaceae bacterium]|nr:PAS domain S-box protein [Trueperaceae bacterium]
MTTAGRSFAHDEVARLVQTLDETQERLDELTGGQVDAVTGAGGAPLLLRAAQARLRQQESEGRAFAATLSGILDALPANVALLDGDATIVAVNAAWRRFGHAGGLADAKAAVGSNYLDICDVATGDGADDAAAVAIGIRSVLAGRAEEFSVEYPCHGPTTPRWFRVMVAPVGTRGGEGGVVVMHVDVSQRRLAEESLLESERGFKRLFDHNPQPMWVEDVDTTRFVAVNKAAVRHYGFTTRELLEMRVSDLLAPTSEVASASAPARDASEGVRQARHRVKGGREIDVEVSSQRLDFGGRASRLTIAADVTRRTEAEAHRARSTSLLRIAGKLAHVGGWALTIAGYVVEWSEEAALIMGRSAEAPPEYHDMLALFAPDSRTQFQTALHACARAGTPFDLELQVPGAGRGRVVRSIGEAQRDSAGRVTRILGALHDITERRLLEEQVHQSQRLESVGQLTGGIAHDFNNMLTVIAGNAELLAERVSTDERNRLLVTMIGDAARRGGELTQRLLAFARRQPLAPRPTDVDDLVAGIDTLLRHSLGEGVDLVVRRSHALWRTNIDPHQLENAIVNLALNARDAMPSGGRLLIETANLTVDRSVAERAVDLVPGEYVRLSVLDTGTGIDRDHLEHVFEPFFTTKPAGKGTGLGLSMVYGFIKQSNGHITIDSKPGEGTTLEMYLPRSLDPLALRTPDARTASARGGDETILVVEDDELVRRFAHEQLVGCGYRVLCATNAAQALETIAADGHVALLFTDVVMPGGMNGAQLAEEARRAWPQLRVLFTSGYSEGAFDDDDGLAAGVHLLPKPYARDELLHQVRIALDAR